MIERRPPEGSGWRRPDPELLQAAKGAQVADPVYAVLTDRA